MSSLDTDSINKLIARLNSLGESEVRRLMVEEHWGKSTSLVRNHVEDWLRSKEAEREIDIAVAAREAAKAARDAASAAREANEIARSADSTAKDALRTARQERTAAAVAAIAAIMAAVIAIIK